MDGGKLKVRLNLIVNYELETVIVGFGENVKVLYPESLKGKISQRLKDAAKQY